MLQDDLALTTEDGIKEVSEEVIKRCRARAKAMLADVKRVNPKQWALITDPSVHVASICPRRAGKSYAGALAALITGEAKPGAISLIISLNKQQLRRIYWSGGPSGLFTLARKYNVKLTYHSSYLRWEHENGSIGYLLGCEDAEQLEVIRGLEADLYLIDECKSFAASKLRKLIDEVIDPQRESRKGRLIMIGTPGFIAMGPFYEATCRTAKDEDGKPWYIPAGLKEDEWGRTANGDLLWSLHHWTLEDNRALPHQWQGALLKKRVKKWTDESPTWVREYLGQWTFDAAGLVFSYAERKQAGQCMWNPERTADNMTGLPKDGNWRFVAGLDFGYEAPTALVICGYSRRYGQLRHVWDFSGRHMLSHEIADMILMAQRRLGITLEVVYADMGNLGKAMAMELRRDYGIPVEKAEKREKLDYIEQLNGAFSLNEVFIIPGTTLETQLLTNAWDIDEELEPPKGMSRKENMGRLGLLVEDDSIPNDSTDALLYLFRGSLHRFGKVLAEAKLEKGTEEYFLYKEKQALAAHRAQIAQDDNALKKQKRLGLPPMSSAIADAVKGVNKWKPKLTRGTSGLSLPF